MGRSVDGNVISAKDLNAMVDSSLRFADRAVADEQSIKGEKHIYRRAVWDFKPFRFELAYHTIDNVSFVLLFDVRDPTDELNRIGIPDTNTYRRLLDFSKVFKKT